MSTYTDWPPTDNYPAPLISTRWQRELIRIAGVAPNGMPFLRLEWGCTTTWTKTTRDLKYSHHREQRQVAWGMHVKDSEGRVVATKRYPFSKGSNSIPLPVDGAIAFPIYEKVEIGIPRFWIAQYYPPTLVGSWEESRRRVIANFGSHADMGPMPTEGIYYLGFHGLWSHDPSRKCCSEAVENRRKCFGFYREPSELDILYVESLYAQLKDEAPSHDWTQTADEKGMYKTLKNLNNNKDNTEAKKRDEMKLRIRDAFKTHKARYTTRKGKDTWIFTPHGNV